MKCLFVGGPADGKWIETNGERYWKVMVLAPLGSRLGYGSEEELVGETVGYIRHHWRDCHGEFLVYTTEKDGLESLVRTLMAGYHPGDAFTGNLATIDHWRFAGMEMKPGDMMPLIERGADTVTLVFHPPIRSDEH